MANKAEMQEEMAPILMEWDASELQALIMDMFEIVLDQNQVRQVYRNVLNIDTLEASA